MPNQKEEEREQITARILKETTEKLTEGAEDRVLWSAQNDASYCEEKAKGFIEKLESLGWTCVETIRDEAAVQ